MSWMVAANGREISLRYPNPADFDIEPMAHSLSTINRFNGHAARPYSVAEHALLTCDIAERYLHLDVYGQFVTLNHDDHESLTGDQSTPSKEEIGQGWRAFECKFSHLVMARLGCLTALTRFHKEVRQADVLALAIERHQLLPHVQPNGQPSTPWPVLAGVPMIANELGIDLMSKERQAATWLHWREAFLHRFYQLQFARTTGDAI